MKYAFQCFVSIFIGCAVCQKFVSAFGLAMDYVRPTDSVDLLVHSFNQKSICAFSSEIPICFSKHATTATLIHIYVGVFVCVCTSISAWIFISVPVCTSAIPRLAAFLTNGTLSVFWLSFPILFKCSYFQIFCAFFMRICNFLLPHRFAAILYAL